MPDRTDALHALLSDIKDYLWPNQSQEWTEKSSALVYRIDFALGLLSTSAPQSESGEWPRNDLRRAFVEGMKWWQYTNGGATAFPAEVDQAEAEAERRYGAHGGSAKAPEFVPVDFKPWLQSLPPEDTKAIFRRVWDLYDGGAAAPSEGGQR